jgi:hypothetical protein
MGKATAKAKNLTLVINRCRLLDWDRIKGFFLQHFSALIQIFNVCRVNDSRAWDHVDDIIFLNQVMTRHFAQLQKIWPHRRYRSSPFQVWWAVFRSYIGQLFDKIPVEMNNWGWDNPRAFGDQVDHSNLQTRRVSKATHTSNRFS